MSHEASCALDDTGGTSFSLYYPATEFRYAIGAFPDGPTAETPRQAGVPGTALPEETVVLPRACDLRADLLDPSGKACTGRRVYVRVAYEDGSKEDFAGQADGRGVLEEKGRVRAAPLVLELRSDHSQVIWRSGRLDGSSAEVLDLGRIVLESGGQTYWARP